MTTTVSQEALARRRAMWRAYRERGELPETPAPYRLPAARRHRRTYWWLDHDEEEEDRPPPEQTRGPLGGGPFNGAWRGSLRQGITKLPTGEAVAV